jgi:hypothetical protein
LQQKKQRHPITSTDDGIIIEVNPLRENTSSAIRVNREFGSISTETSDVQQKKQE